MCVRLLGCRTIVFVLIAAALALSHITPAHRLEFDFGHGLHSVAVLATD